MKVGKVVVAVLVVLLVLAGCGSVAPTPKIVTVEKTVIVEKIVTPTPAPTNPPATKMDVQLGWLYNDEFTAFAVAEEKGYYREKGLNPHFFEGGGSTSSDPIRAINGFSSKQKIGVPAAMSLVLAAKAEGLDVVAVAALTQFEPSGFIYLIGRSDVAEKGPCDFKGKTVSMQSEASWYASALGAACYDGALVPGDGEGSTFKLIPAGWTPDCLLSGQCDFYCGWATNQIFALEQQGFVQGKDFGMFLTSDYLPFYYADVVVTTSAYIKEHPEVVKAFVEASMEGLQYTIDHPQEAAQIVSAIPGVDLAHANWRIPIQNGLALSEDTKKNGLGYLDVAKVQQMIDFLFKNGQITASFKAEEVIDNSFLPGPSK